jgi:3-methyladenine DNA glycosylase AlkD
MSQGTPVNHQQAHEALTALANPSKAAFLSGFFKTGKGQYAEGDRFLGLTVPALRTIAKRFRQLSLKDCERLLSSPFNDERALALLILVEDYRKGDAGTKNSVYRACVNNRSRINNWNLVDTAAPHIFGFHLLERDRSLLYRLAKSRILWDRRIGVVATLPFIRAGDFGDTFKLTNLLLGDEQDLIHKACGWMLREVGKRNASALEEYLRRHHCSMPRTMLRYAIERFSPRKRSAYLRGAV